MSLIALASGAAERTWWTHDLDPVIVQFTEHLALRWYGLAYAAGAVVAWFLMRRFARQGHLPLEVQQVEDFVLYGGFLPLFVGGRLGYCLLYASDRLLDDPLYVFRVWEGGMASHGGIVGLALGVIWYAHRRGVSAAVLCDAVGATAPAGVFFGRLANFINGELWGRPTQVPWAVIFPEATRTLDAGVPTPRHPSQLYAAVLEGLLVLAVGLWVYRKTTRPGLTSGTVLVTYGIVRFIDEFWRQPDEGYELFLGWMSKGQLFTLPVLAIGTAVIFYAFRRPPAPEKFLVPQSAGSSR